MNLGHYAAGGFRWRTTWLQRHLDVPKTRSSQCCYFLRQAKASRLKKEIRRLLEQEPQEPAADQERIGEQPRMRSPRGGREGAGRGIEAKKCWGTTPALRQKGLLKISDMNVMFEWRGCQCIKQFDMMIHFCSQAK